jgi:hypothetical protein
MPRQIRYCFPILPLSINLNPKNGEIIMATLLTSGAYGITKAGEGIKATYDACNQENAEWLWENLGKDGANKALENLSETWQNASVKGALKGTGNFIWSLIPTDKKINQTVNPKVLTTLESIEGLTGLTALFAGVRNVSDASRITGENKANGMTYSTEEGMSTICAFERAPKDVKKLTDRVSNFMNQGRIVFSSVANELVPADNTTQQHYRLPEDASKIALSRDDVNARVNSVMKSGLGQIVAGTTLLSNSVRSLFTK